MMRLRQPALRCLSPLRNTARRSTKETGEPVYAAASNGGTQDDGMQEIRSRFGCTVAQFRLTHYPAGARSPIGRAPASVYEPWQSRGTGRQDRSLLPFAYLTSWLHERFAGSRQQLISAATPGSSKPMIDLPACSYAGPYA